MSAKLELKAYKNLFEEKVSVKLELKAYKNLFVKSECKNK